MHLFIILSYFFCQVTINDDTEKDPDKDDEEKERQTEDQHNSIVGSDSVSSISFPFFGHAPSSSNVPPSSEVWWLHDLWMSPIILKFIFNSSLFFYFSYF